MPKASPLINIFNGGEISPKLDTRSDLQKYSNGCLIMENMIPLVEGGAQSRPGTYYVCSTKTSSTASRLIAFQFSTVQAYQLEFGDYYIRFYKDQGQIVVAYAAWLTGQAYALGTLRTEAGSYYRCIVAHTSGVFANDLAAGYWEVTGGATDLAYEIPSPYAAADLFELKFCQSADVLWIVHPSYPPKTLTRTAHTTWVLDDYQGKILAAMTITGITNANPAVVTCADVSVYLTAGQVVYIEGVTTMVEVNDLFFEVAAVTTGAGGHFQLVGIDSTTYGVYGGTGTAQWCAFGSADKCPSCVAFFEQRLWFGATNDDPSTIWGSASGDYYDHEQDASDDSKAIQYKIVSDRADRIRWMIGETSLILGTTGSLWKISSSGIDEAITQTNVKATRQTGTPCKDMDAELLQDAVVYLQKGGTTLRAAGYSFDRDKYVSADLTRIAKHVTKGTSAATSGVDDMDYQAEPFSILWCVRADGQLLGMTYEPEEKIYGWFRFITDGEFESVSVLSQEGVEDEVWVIVKRTIGSTDYRYIEYFTSHEIYGSLSNAFCMDSGLQWDGTIPTAGITGITQANPAVVTCVGHTLTNGQKVRITDVSGMTEVNQDISQAYTVANAAADTFELSGIDSSGWAAYTSGGTAIQVANSVSELSHLQGKSVAVLTDLGSHAQCTVAGGAITLAYYANKIKVGLPYTCDLMPMKIEPGSTTGTSRGKKKRITSLSVAFYNTYGAEWGVDEDNLYAVPFGTGGTPTLFTGDKETNFDMNFNAAATILIRQALPFPMTVLSMAPMVVTDDE